MDLLNKDQIFAADDLEQEVVEVPEWNGTVIVRGATAAEYEDYQQSLYVTNYDVKGKPTLTKNLANSKARLVIRCIVNDKGERIFTDGEAGKLGAKSAAVVNRLYDKVMDLSGMSTKAQEEIEGNSAAGQIADSPKTSPAT
jgi:hypothetical protein